jgi:hypothetical protein
MSSSVFFRLACLQHTQGHLALVAVVIFSLPALGHVRYIALCIGLGVYVQLTLAHDTLHCGAYLNPQLLPLSTASPMRYAPACSPSRCCIVGELAVVPGLRLHAS